MGDTSDNEKDPVKEDRKAMADITGGRAMIYHFLVELFSHLPDKNFLSKILGTDSRKILDGLYHLQVSECQIAVTQIRGFLAEIQSETFERMVTELSLDRTRIIRPIGSENLKPPYEGIYVKQKGMGDSVLAVKRLYRKAGIIPDEAIGETPDYLCVELDFMCQMCLREQGFWETGADISETLKTEWTFLQDHLERWVHEFCRQAKKEAKTEFYQGALGILDAFVAEDRRYLQIIYLNLDESSNESTP